MNVDYINRHPYTINNKKDYSKRLKEFFTKIKLEESEKRFCKKCKTYENYNFINKKITIKYIENYLNEGKPLLVPLNIAVVYNKNKMWPHYIDIVGFDSQNFYIHNVYPKNQPYQKVRKKTLMKAMASEGLDMCVIVPFRNL